MSILVSLPLRVSINILYLDKNLTLSHSAGKLSYDVKPERKELSVRVTDMLEDYDYFLRLCRNDFICKGTGAETKVRPSMF